MKYAITIERAYHKQGTYIVEGTDLHTAKKEALRYFEDELSSLCLEQGEDDFNIEEASEVATLTKDKGVWHNAKVNKLWIRFYYHNGMDYLPESEQEHIEEEVEKGFIEGELNYYSPYKGEETRGYWKLQ
jgi:hypothetical protein